MVLLTCFKTKNTSKGSEEEVDDSLIQPIEKPPLKVV
jgi:hypothetical protein